MSPTPCSRSPSRWKRRTAHGRRPSRVTYSPSLPSRAGTEGLASQVCANHACTPKQEAPGEAHCSYTKTVHTASLAWYRRLLTLAIWSKTRWASRRMVAGRRRRPSHTPQTTLDSPRWWTATMRSRLQTGTRQRARVFTALPAHAPHTLLRSALAVVRRRYVWPAAVGWG